MAPTDFIWNHERRGQQSLSWSETTRLSVGLRVQVRQRVAGDGPRTDQNNDGKGVKRAEVPPAENFPGCPGGCLSAVCVPWSSICVSGSWSCGCLVLPGVGCWVPVSGALASSLVVGCCPCLPGSGFCAGFREKGRRPKNRSRRSFARAGLFQGFPGMLAVLERRYRGRILTLVRTSSSIYEKRLHALLTHRRGPVEEPPRAERALRGGSQFRFPAYCFVVQLRFEVSGIPAILTVLCRTRLLFEISWGHYRCWAAEFWGSCVHSWMWPLPRHVGAFRVRRG